MDTKKTIKYSAILLMCVFGIALIGFNIYLHQQIKKATQGVVTKSSASNVASDSTPGTLSSYPKSTNQNSPLASAQIQTGNNETDELSYQLEAAQEELELISQRVSEDEAKKAEQRKIQKELQKRYREDPSYKKRRKQSLDIQYADLFKKLDLSSEKLDKFKDLLVDEMTAQQDIYYEYNTEDDTVLSKEQQEELNKRYQALDKEYESKKADLLGEDEYEKYQAYTNTWCERYNVNAFIETLDSGEKLTETQKEALIEAMNDEMKNVVWERADDESESSSNMYDEKNMAQILANYNRRIDAYSKAAGSILSASQLEKFNTYLQKDRDQYKLIMEMSALRYGSSTTETSNKKESE